MKIIQLRELQNSLSKVAYDVRVNSASYLIEHNGLRIGYFSHVEELDELLEPFHHTTDIKNMKTAYSLHKSVARNRGIEWFFNFITWADWWNRQKGFDWMNKRGTTKGKYVMARKGDKGPYAVWNVECKTVEDNHRDRTLNGLTVCGEKHHCSKVTTQQVLEIYKSHEPHLVLSAKYGINKTAVRDIKVRKSWKHVTVGLGAGHSNPPGRPKKQHLQTI
jgi:hypothetical protein